MKKKEQELTLCQWLIQKIDTKSYRAGTLTGMMHPSVDQKLLDTVGGLRTLIEQAREMERDPILGDKVRFVWKQMGTDIETIHFSVDIIGELCQREGIEDPRTRQLRHIRMICSWRQKTAVSWLESYFAHLLSRLEAGDEIRDTDLEDEGWFACLHAAAANEHAVWERVFSAAVLGDVEIKDDHGRIVPPTKRFQKRYKSRLCGILMKYSPYYEDGMTDDELLAAHGILTYAQTLEWKGPLVYQLKDQVINTSCLRFGAVLNAQTLERAVLVSMPGVKRVIIIENKANYESMPYEEDTLYIYCHGFFSPKERAFLKMLPELAKADTQFLHWGDMDYGGIRIFQYNKKHLFPVLKPWRMGQKDYLEALGLGAGIELEAAKREKLKKMDAGELEEVKQCILEHNEEIEQEVLLAKQYLSHEYRS